MKVVRDEKGGAANDVLQPGEMDTLESGEGPEPGEEDVRVKMAYSAINPFDIS